MQLAIRAELSTMSMEEILNLKETLGSKIYNRAIGANKLGSDTAISPSNQDKKKHQKGIFSTAEIYSFKNLLNVMYCLSFALKFLFLILLQAKI